jgi:hypothetical protein
MRGVSLLQRRVVQPPIDAPRSFDRRLTVTPHQAWARLVTSARPSPLNLRDNVRAHLLDEYWPYPTTDPSLAKFRGELAEYNPGTATLEKILGTLSL